MTLVQELAFQDSEFEDFERLRFARDDLREAGRYLQRLLKRKYYRSGPLAVDANAFYTAFVVTYCRPFSGNRDRRNKRAPTTMSPFLDRLPTDLREVHEALVRDRDQRIAHSDGTTRQVELHRLQSGQRVALVRGSSPTIGDEAKFRSIERMIEGLLGMLTVAIEELEPLQQEKADRRGRYPPPVDLPRPGREQVDPKGSVAARAADDPDAFERHLDVTDRCL